MDVTEAPEIPGLPPVQGQIEFSTELIDDSNPAQPQPSLPTGNATPLPQGETAQQGREGRSMMFIAATVYDRQKTLLHIHPLGKADQSVTAWSNLDFNHFSGLSDYEIKHADGSIHRVSMVMSINNTSVTEQQRLNANTNSAYQPPAAPNLPDLANGAPAFAVVGDELTGRAKDTLEQIHDLYRKEGERMRASFEAREVALAERKAFLLANPPEPADVKIRYSKKSQ